MTQHNPIREAGLQDVLGHGVSRRQLLRYTAAGSAAAALTVTLGACGGPQSTNQVPQQGGGGGSNTNTNAPKSIEATLAYTATGGFDPMNASGAVATCVNAHVLEALVELDPITRKPYLALAKEDPKESADKLSWTATLRDGAKFSDGAPVTAEDVVWSFKRCLDPANKALMAGFIYMITDVAAKDDKTVEFKLKHPFALFKERIATIKVVPKAKTGTTDAAKAFDNAPVGSGPYKLDSASKEQGVKMSKNPNYNGKRVATVDTMSWNTTTEASARVSDLEGGRVQAIEQLPYLNVASMKNKFQVDEVQGFNCLFLMFNGGAKPFDDKRVRQALHYAIDKDKLIKTALQGFGTATTSYLDEGNPGFQKAATVYNYDPEKAKKLLSEAGATGAAFDFHTTDVAFIKDSAPLIVEAWKTVGLNPTLKTMPSSAIYATEVPRDSFRVLGASGDPTIFGPDTDLLLRWFYYGATWPTQRARTNPAVAKEIADLIDAAAKEQDQAKQKQSWKQILDRVAEEANMYPVFHTKVVTASDSKKLSGFKGAPTTGIYFLDAKRTA